MTEGRGPRERALATTRGLSRADVASLRRGELDAATVSAMMEKTAGLAAPAAPPEGDLVPNGTGWRIGDGGPLKRVYPRLWKWALRCVALTGFGPTWALLLNVQHYPYLASMTLGVLPFAVTYGSASLLATIKLRALKRAPSWSNLADCPPGETVRLEGVVAPGATVPTLFRGEPAVLFQSVAGMVQQTQGIDFDLDCGSQLVHVAVRRALLLDRPTRTREPPACGPISVELGNRLTSNLLNDPSLLSRLVGEGRRYEASIGPGDRIEVCGVLHREPDLEARAPFARQIPARTVIRAGKLPLLVRRLG